MRVPADMILYALVCEDGHRFESWFRDSASYEDQARSDLVACPTCSSSRVSKAIMAPAICQPLAACERATETEPSAEVEAPSVDDARGRALREAVRMLHEKITSEAQDVGSRFATEARRMHFGETPMRQIYGVASHEEARSLVEDGVTILPMPAVPDELN